MELHGLIGICWCVLSASGKLAAGNYEEGWSRIDEEEKAMAVDGESRIEQSGRKFERLQEETNGSLVSNFEALKRRGVGDSLGRS
jgi:hypothetical protein